jgi:hypothetical protein
LWQRPILPTGAQRPGAGGAGTGHFSRARIGHQLQARAAIAVEAAIGDDLFGSAELRPVAVGLMAALDAGARFASVIDQPPIAGVGLTNQPHRVSGFGSDCRASAEPVQSAPHSAMQSAVRSSAARFG